MTPALDVVLGPCDDMRAEVFLRVRGAMATATRLAATLTGPRCSRATTLPTTVRAGAVPGPPGAAPLARAILTEPAFWTPELPNLYRLEAMLSADGHEVAGWRREVGLRRLGVRGRSFRLDGRRWVPRGCRVGAGFATEPFRDGAATAVLADPDEDACSRADTDGVAVVAVAQAANGGPLEPDAAIGRIRDWSAHPAACLALLPSGTALAAAEAVAAAVGPGKGTLLLGWWADGAAPPPPRVPPGIDWLAVAVGPAGTPHPAWRTAPPVPLVACGGAGARAGCDALQAALAAWGLAGGGLPWDWAGYLVW